MALKNFWLFILLKYPSQENLKKHLHFTGASITPKYAKQYTWWSSDCLNATLGVIWGRIEDNKLAYCWSWESINSHTRLVKEITLIPSDKKAFLLLQGQELWGGELALLVELLTAIKKKKGRSLFVNNNIPDDRSDKKVSVPLW